MSTSNTTLPPNDDELSAASKILALAAGPALVRMICENDMLNGESIRLDGAIRLAPK